MFHIVRVSDGELTIDIPFAKKSNAKRLVKGLAGSKLYHVVDQYTHEFVPYHNDADRVMITRIFDHAVGSWMDRAVS